MENGDSRKGGGKASSDEYIDGPVDERLAGGRSARVGHLGLGAFAGVGALVLSGAVRTGRGGFGRAGGGGGAVRRSACACGRGRGTGGLGFRGGRGGRGASFRGSLCRALAFLRRGGVSRANCKNETGSN